MLFTGGFKLFLSHWTMSLVMAGGSFIAGASSESGGAFAFPVMSLVYNYSPNVIRNFSLAVQSIGMTSATLFILSKKILIDKKYLLFSTAGGSLGIIIGGFFLRNTGSPDYIKMLFFSFWLSFAFVLFYLNHIKKREVCDRLPHFNPSQKLILTFIGFLGGILSAILGSGIDIFTFAYVTMKYNLSEKVATPTSVIIMAVNSIIGFLLHYFILSDFGREEFQILKVCIPVVIFGAPLGVYFVNRIKRTQIANFLYIIISAQFILALFFIKPDLKLLGFSALVFFSGIVIFSYFGKVILITAVLKKIVVPERFIGRTFTWDKNKSAGINIRSGFWNGILNKKKFFIPLVALWITIIFIFSSGNIMHLLKSPVPYLIIIVSIVASVIANSTAAGGGIIFLPLFSFIFLGPPDVLNFTNSYFATQTYTLSGVIIAIHITQAFGMLSGSISWWKSGVKILIEENIFNIAGIIIGVIFGKYYWTLNEAIVYKIFGSINLLMSFAVIYNLLIIKNISTKTSWPRRYVWIFFFIGIAGGLLSAWTSIGIGSMTSFVLILLLKPEIGIANGSVMMALTSIVTVIVHIFLQQYIPVEIIIFTIPAVLIGGYAAPFFGMWIGKKLYRLLDRIDPGINVSRKGTKIEKYIMEYTSGQLMMSVTFIIVCLLNGLYYLFL